MDWCLRSSCDGSGPWSTRRLIFERPEVLLKWTMLFLLTPVHVVEMGAVLGSACHVGVVLGGGARVGWASSKSHGSLPA